MAPAAKLSDVFSKPEATGLATKALDERSIPDLDVADDEWEGHARRYALKELYRDVLSADEPMAR